MLDHLISGIDALRSLRHLRDASCDAEAVQRHGGQTAQNQKIKCSSHQIGSRFHGPPVHPIDMWATCAHASNMSKMIQIRNVPDTLHRKLKARAADSGQTLSDYLLAELERLAARPTRQDMLARLHSRKRVTLKTPAAVVIREERESA